MENKTKVIVGMSGGVDSSVTALILKNKGYEVIGVTLDIWQDCNSINRQNSINDAKKICDMLEIKHLVFDVKEEFRKRVIDPFAKEYMEAKTPNPCVRCNKYLKFEALLQKAKELNVNFIATGHYANIEKDEISGRYYIKKSINDKKDQSYVLFDLTQEQLSHIIMPLGEYSKEEIRKIAEENGFINANKKDSQDICFIENNDYASFIEKEYIYKSKIGNFVDLNGKKLGIHKGIVNYTVGQRRGLGLSLKYPMYVVKVDKEKNEVILGREEELLKYELICKNINLMKIENIDIPIKVKAKIRYNAKEAEATIIKIEKDKIKVDFVLPQKGIAPGQAVVFYDDDKCIIGGGIIE